MDLCVSRVFRRCSGLLLLVGLVAMPVWAQGSSTIIGTVLDSESRKPLADVVITATSSSLQGERVVVTDNSGAYRLPQLPSGSYTLRAESEGHRPYVRSGVQLRVDATVRVNLELLPEALEMNEDLVVTARTPDVDVGSTSTGFNVSAEFARRVALVPPSSRGGSTRSFESLAEVAPGAQADSYGISINGASSPENGFVIDGLSVGDPAFGILGTQLSLEFVQEVNVVTGGFMPEFGRATGGIMNVVTKSGSNEFHGSVFGTMTPGAIQPLPQHLPRQDSSIGTQVRLWNQADVGAELGGPLLKDKLWFYVGLNGSGMRHQLERTLFRTQLDERGRYVRDQRGNLIFEPIPGAQQDFFADQRAFQYFGKLTYNINPDHSLALSVMGTPWQSGGDGRFGYDPEDGRVETSDLAGSYTALAHRYANDVRDIALKLNSSFLDKKVLLDVNVGWHHQSNEFLPSDGSALGSSEGLAGIPRFNYRRSQPRSLYEFEPGSLLDPSVCDRSLLPAGANEPCPVPLYAYAGPGRLNDDVLDRYALRAVGTWLVEALGHHVAKVGVDLEHTATSGRVAFSGRVTYREARNGRWWLDHRSMGYMVGPNQAEVLPLWQTASTSNAIGAFLQDSWNILDKVQLNAGLRYDIQTLYGANGQLAVAMPNQLSPRIGVVYDFTQQGKGKLYANYARYFQNTLMEMVNAQFPGERRLQAGRWIAGNASRPGCDPLRQAPPFTECRDPSNQRGLDEPGVDYTHPQDPNNQWLSIRGNNVPVDPNLQPQSSDEVVVGAEYQLFEDGRVGLSYTRRYMNAVIEDMSRDEATSFFLGNPGQGIAREFPRAVRDYDQVVLFFDKRFSNQWLAQVSYTWSYLRGNYSGLFRPESGQLAPNITSDFDLVSLLQNREGPLPADRTHAIKVFTSKEFDLPGRVKLDVGVTYRGASGAPLNVLGSHPVYATGQTFILPRGAGGRLPWTNTVDTRVGVGYPLGNGMLATVGLDVFNLFNFQEAIARDQNYTFDDVFPILGGSVRDLPNLRLRSTEDEAVIKNLNYLQATAYQTPRSFRVSAKVSF
jgi:outer membrane receptor protein involved in Fe transport